MRSEAPTLPQGMAHVRLAGRRGLSAWILAEGGTGQTHPRPWGGGGGGDVLGEQGEGERRELALLDASWQLAFTGRQAEGTVWKMRDLVLLPPARVTKPVDPVTAGTE